MTYIIAFAGRKQSGKTTSALFVKSLIEKLTTSSCVLYNFADPLKESICIEILGLTHGQCYGSDAQKNELVDCYWDDGKQMTAREVMQFVGTNVFRKMKNDVWSKATINKIHREKPSVAIIADCRFPNEVESVKRAGGIVIKLTRNPFDSQHESETALDNNNYDQSIFDLIIDNKLMSIEESNNNIYKFFLEKGLLPL